MSRRESLTSEGDGKPDPLNPEFVNNDENKDEEKEKEKEKKKDEYPAVGFFQLFRYANGLDKFLTFVAVVAAGITAACQPLNMLVFGNFSGHLIDYAISNHTDKDVEKFEDDVLDFVIYNCSLGVATLIFTYISSLIFNYTGIRQSFKIRTLYFEKVLNQDIGWYDVHQSGDFASRMGDDLLKLEEGIGEKVIIFVHLMFTFFGCLIMALVQGWELALICLISLPVTVISMGIVAYLTSKLSKSELDAYGAAGTIAEEVFSIIRTVLAFGGQKKELDRYEKHLIFAKNNNIKRSLLTGIGFGILWFAIYASYALAFWYGVGLIIEDREDHPNKDDRTYTPSNMVTVFFSVMTGSMNFGIASPYIESFGVARGAASKIFGIIDSIPKINISKGKGVQPDKVEGNIKFENIKFNYPSRPDVPILRGLNLEIKPGQTVALVGSSGCGKSTVIQLLQRFYDPDEGTVYVDGQDLTTLDLTVLRSNIGVVGQEPVLFATTIAENIRYGYKWASMEDIEKAAKKSNAHQFISSLPDGYNTIVGERGAQLSGGQKQRIAIARALVRDPSILLLDEATSALDTKSESKVQAALDNASKECTTIIIAHRLSTIRGANRIIVIKEGQSVEDGTHAELMALKQEYYKLVTNQVADVDDEESNKIPVMENDDEDDNIPVTHKEAKEVVVDDEDDKDASILKVLAMNKPESTQLIIGIACSVVMGFAMPLFGVLFGDIISVVGQEGRDNYVREETNKYCLMFVIMGVITGLATLLQIYTFGYAGEHLVMRVRGNMFGSMLRQEIGWYDRTENGVGALCAKLSTEAANIQGATGQRVGTIFQSIATLTLAIALAMYYEWRLGLVALAFTPVIMAAIFLQQRMLQNETKAARKGMENSTKLAVEAVSNIRTVASLGNESTFHSKYVEELIPHNKKAKVNTHYRGLVLGVARSVMFFSYATCMYYGSYLMRTDGLEMDRVLKVTQSLMMGTITIANALAFTPNMQKGLTAAAKVFKLLNRQPKVDDPANPISMENLSGDINYTGIGFQYPTRPDMKILKGLDLLITRGQTIALVGHSGCGKSTIIQLIERFYDPAEGKVAIMDKDIQSMLLTDLRSHLGIVSQEPNLFDRTILQNIQYGDNSRDVTEAEAIEAAKQANVHNFIVSLPKGYDTPLGDKGTQLSGGQKQRVAIARALVRNPQILLLDEATSALDTESEKIVQEALDKAKQGRTCITIAHRLSTIQNADVICVINEGTVHELGTHSQLLAQKGIYYQLYSLQNGKK